MSKISRWAAAAFGALAAVTLVTAAPAVADDAPAACSTTSTGGTIPQSVTKDNNRPYLLNVPAGLPNPAPLLVAVHGGQDNPAHFESVTGWTPYVAQKKAIVAYPRGSKDDGNGNWSWDFAHNSGDVTVLRDMVAQISAQYCVDQHRIYFSGHSNGGQMTSRMACDATDLVASAAVYAGPAPTLSDDDCPASRPISFGVMLADDDPLVWQVVAEQHRDLWRRKDSCGTSHTETGPEVLTGTRYDCAAGTQVVYRLYDNGGHLWPGGARGADVRDRMWSLFTASPRP
ncbi:alpha/beta hydrolase family esterase [Nocardia sp. NPDC003482]